MIKMLISHYITTTRFKLFFTLKMAHNEKMTNRVREALAHLPDVEEKKMFRGIAFMVNGKMCVSTGDERLMCRIDPEAHDEAVKKTGCETMIMKGREYKGYVYVREDSIKTKKELEYWISLALDFNSRAKASKKSPKSGTVKTAGKTPVNILKKVPPKKIAKKTK